MSGSSNTRAASPATCPATIKPASFFVPALNPQLKNSQLPPPLARSLQYFQGFWHSRAETTLNLMPLEFEKYPKDIKLKDGSKSKFRPLRKDDEKEFHEFFLAVPEAERMFIKHRVTELQVIREWCQNIDLGRNLPLLGGRGRQNRWRRHPSSATRRLEAPHWARQRARAS